MKAVTESSSGVAPTRVVPARCTLGLAVIIIVALFLFGAAPGSVVAAGTGWSGEGGAARLVSRLAGGRIGDAIPFVLEIRLADGAVLDDASLAGLEIRPDQLPPALFKCTLDPFDREQALRKKVLSLSGRLVIYAPGGYRIAPTRLVCRMADAEGKIRLVELPVAALMVRVAALQPELATSNLSLVIPGPPPPLPTVPAAAAGRVAAASYLGILFLLLALFCGIGVYLELRAVRISRPESGPETGKSPRSQLEKLLRETRETGSWQELIPIDHQLRRLLIEELALPANRLGGCGKTFAGRLSKRLPPESLRELAAIYAEIDHLISREEVGSQQVTTIKQRLQAWLKNLSGTAKKDSDQKREDPRS